MVRATLLLVAFLSSVDAYKMAIDSEGGLQSKIMRQEKAMVDGQASNVADNLMQTLSERSAPTEDEMALADQDGGPIYDCTMEEAWSTEAWTHVQNQAAATDKKRWCHDLSATDKGTCEGSYTHRACPAAGQLTEYLKCVWNENGMPQTASYDADSDRKCYAQAAYMCPEGMGGDLNKGVAGHPDPCLATTSAAADGDGYEAPLNIEPNNDCSEWKKGQTYWQPISLRQEATGDARWCGSLISSNKTVCEQSYTWICPTEKGVQEGVQTQYLKCKWFDEGKPVTQNGGPHFDDKIKCFAHSATVCPLHGILNRQDPC